MGRCECKIDVDANGVRILKNICDFHRSLSESLGQMKLHAADYLRGNGLTKITMTMNSEGIVDQIQVE